MLGGGTRSDGRRRLSECSDLKKRRSYVEDSGYANLANSVSPGQKYSTSVIFEYRVVFCIWVSFVLKWITETEKRVIQLG